MTRHALLIGVENYGSKAGLKNLHCPGNDIRLLEEMFSDPAFGGDPARTETHIDIRHDEAERVLFRFLKRLGRDDVAVVHFSGHGLQDDAGDLHLCFTDTVRDELEITALAVEGLRRMLDRARARKVLVTLDCCYSGAAGEQLTRDDLSSQLHKVEEKFGDGTGVYVLSASGSTETAKENKELGTGVFTHHLVEGIRTGKADRDGDGLITVSEIAEYLSREVPKDAARQTPHLWAEKVSGTFVVAVNRTVAAAREVARFKEALHGLIDARAISLSFAAEIETWLGRAETTIENPGERWELMCRLADGEVTAGDFQEQWRRATEKKARDREARNEAPPPRQPERRQPDPRQPEAPGRASRRRRGFLGRAWSGGGPAPAAQPEPPPRRETGAVPETAADGRKDGWFSRQFTTVGWLFVTQAISVITLGSMISAFDSYPYDYDSVVTFAGLGLLLCVFMVRLAVRIVVGWRQSPSALWARILALALAVFILPITLIFSLAALLN